MKRTAVAMALTAALIAAGSLAHGATKPTDKTTNLPKIWQDAGPQERLTALRVAELDATRLLLERIYGVQVNSDTTIYDLVLQSDAIRSGIRDTIRGVTSTEKEEYREDGQVWVVRAVKLRQVLETVTKTLREKKNWIGGVTVEQMQKVERENQDTVIAVMGNGALPGSVGLQKIQAKRAAEIDAYRKLAERMMGVEISSTTKVKDFVLESDEIRARAAALVKGAKPVKIEYETTDNSCAVTMEVKIADIFNVIQHYSKKAAGMKEELLKVEREYETKTLTETGYGAPRAEGFAGEVLKSSSEQGGEKPFAETEIVIKRLIGQEIVVD